MRDNLIVKTRAKKRGNGWLGHCPSHDDRNPSFSISETEQGKVLFKCHAGCTQSSVIDALNEMGIWKTNKQGRS